MIALLKKVFRLFDGNQMKSIGIIGGGIIGLCTAWYLTEEGFEVTVLDKSHFNNGCSYGNAGMIVPSHFVPLASPAALANGIKWLFSPKSPLYIKPVPDLNLALWLWKFYRFSTAANVASAIPFLSKISLLSKNLYLELEHSKVLDFSLEKKGILMLYQTTETEKEEIALAAQANKLGIEAQVLSKNDIETLNPTVEYNVRGAVYFPGDAHLNPGHLMKSMKLALEKKGVDFITGHEVRNIGTKKKRVTGIDVAGKEVGFDLVVLTAGSWTGKLLKKIGVNLPLIGGKGYSFHINNNVGASIPCLLQDHRVSLTPMCGSLRLGGTMELTNMNKKVNIQRVQAIAEAVNHYFPGMNESPPEPDTVWMGYRPCSPDGLPVFGRVGKFDNLFVATGHGMMGISLGPATGKLMSQIIAGRQTEMDVSAFDPARFVPV